MSLRLDLTKFATRGGLKSLILVQQVVVTRERDRGHQEGISNLDMVDLRGGRCYILFGSSSSLQLNSIFLLHRSSTSFQPPVSQQYFSLTPLQPPAPALAPAQRTKCLSAFLDKKDSSGQTLEVHSQNNTSIMGGVQERTYTVLSVFPVPRELIVLWAGPVLNISF